MCFFRKMILKELCKQVWRKIVLQKAHPNQILDCRYFDCAHFDTAQCRQYRFRIAGIKSTIYCGTQNNLLVSNPSSFARTTSLSVIALSSVGVRDRIHRYLCDSPATSAHR